MSYRINNELLYLYLTFINGRRISDSITNTNIWSLAGIIDLLMEYLNTLKDKSNEELLKMAYEFTTWSPEMLQGVEQELKDRKILPPDLKEKKDTAIIQEDVELTEGKQASLLGQVIGWVTLLGFLGVFIGYHYAFSKRKSSFTDKIYYTYNESSRTNGKYLFYISLTLFTLILIYRYFI